MANPLKFCCVASTYNDQDSKQACTLYNTATARGSEYIHINKHLSVLGLYFVWICTCTWDGHLTEVVKAANVAEMEQFNLENLIKALFYAWDRLNNVVIENVMLQQVLLILQHSPQHPQSWAEGGC